MPAIGGLKYRTVKLLKAVKRKKMFQSGAPRLKHLILRPQHSLE